MEGSVEEQKAFSDFSAVVLWEMNAVKIGTHAEVRPLLVFSLMSGTWLAGDADLVCLAAGVKLKPPEVKKCFSLQNCNVKEEVQM